MCSLVNNEELKGDIPGYSLCLLAKQPKLQFGCSRSGVNVRAHVLHQNLSRNYCSIRSGPLFVGLCHVLGCLCIGQLYPIRRLSSVILGVVRRCAYS